MGCLRSGPWIPEGRAGGRAQTNSKEKQQEKNTKIKTARENPQENASKVKPAAAGFRETLATSGNLLSSLGREAAIFTYRHAEMHELDRGLRGGRNKGGYSVAWPGRKPLPTNVNLPLIVPPPPPRTHTCTTASSRRKHAPKSPVSHMKWSRPVRVGEERDEGGGRGKRGSKACAPHEVVLPCVDERGQDRDGAKGARSGPTLCGWDRRGARAEGAGRRVLTYVGWAMPLHISLAAAST